MSKKKTEVEETLEVAQAVEIEQVADATETIEVAEVVEATPVVADENSGSPDENSGEPDENSGLPEPEKAFTIEYPTESAAKASGIKTAKKIETTDYDNEIVRFRTRNGSLNAGRRSVVLSWGYTPMD